MLKKYKLVTPAKSVGIVCGQSIGEMQTQTTLNTFHKCGLTEKIVVQGVPRFLEIIDTNRSETQSTPTSYIFLKAPQPRSISEIRAIVGSSLVYFSFGQLYQGFRIESNIHERWYDYWNNLGNLEGRLCIVYEMNLDILFRYKISLGFIVEKLQETFPQYTMLYSPLFYGRIDIWCDPDQVDEMVISDEIHPLISQTKICGIDRIQNIFFMRDPTTQEWYIETDGSNLHEILNLKYVDIYRTYSNDIWETYNIFGIEAVRSYIVEELRNLMPSIHDSHILLLADRMTLSGKLRSISRYTRKNESSSILSKTTFEETLSGFLRAAVTCEIDHVRGVSAAIVCSRIPLVGTGMNDLMCQM
jgi:DNA-directed RNA polymerase subunit A"